MKDRVDSLQTSLGMMRPGTVTIMSNLWLQAGLKPGDVYGMMPISVSTTLSRGAKEERKRPTNVNGLVLWLDYIDRSKVKNVVDGEYDVVQQLTSVRDREELVVLFFLLRDTARWKHRADSLLRSLTVIQPESVKLVLPRCLGKKVNPKEVFDMLPIAEERFLTQGVRDSVRWPDIHRKLVPWLWYVSEYNVQRIAQRTYWRGQTFRTSYETCFYPEQFILGALMLHSTMEDLVAFL